MSKFTFNMPDVGEGVAEAEIVGWQVKIGDVVEEDQHLVDVMTDKATIDIESPVAGTVVELAGAEGDTIAVGAMLLVIEVEGEGADEHDRSRTDQGIRAREVQRDHLRREQRDGGGREHREGLAQGA